MTDGRTDRQTDGQTDICDSRVAFATENMFDLKARGSEPPAQIRWYLGESPLDNFKIEV